MKKYKKNAVFITMPAARKIMGTPWELWGDPGNILGGPGPAPGVPKAPVDGRWRVLGTSGEVLKSPRGPRKSLGESPENVEPIEALRRRGPGPP